MAEFNKKTIDELKPVEFTYQFGSGKEETLSKTFIPFSNGLSYFRHDGLIGARDVIVSKNNYMILTDVQPLSSVFDPALQQECFPGEVHNESLEIQRINLGQIPGSFYLRALSASPEDPNETISAYVSESNLTDEVIATFDPNTTHPSHVLTPIIFTLLPLGNNKAELVANRTKRVIVDRIYPFTMRLTEEVLNEADLDKKTFEFVYRYVGFDKPKVNWTSTNVNQGDMIFRSEITETTIKSYICSNFKDGVVRANGTMFNDFHVNPYIFRAEFVSKEQLPYNFNPKATYEIKYQDEPISSSKKGNIYIKNKSASNTHFLASCPTEQIKPTENSNKTKITLNLATLKTNFVSTGTYFHKET